MDNSGGGVGVVSFESIDPVCERLFLVGIGKVVYASVRPSVSSVRPSVRASRPIRFVSVR
jgi:hypothetical protein